MGKTVCWQEGEEAGSIFSAPLSCGAGRWHTSTLPQTALRPPKESLQQKCVFKASVADFNLLHLHIKLDLGSD